MAERRTLVDLTHGGRTFRIERDPRTGRQAYLVDAREVDVRTYLALMIDADTRLDRRQLAVIRGKPA